MSESDEIDRLLDDAPEPPPIGQVEEAAAEVIVVEIDPSEELPPEPPLIVVRNRFGPGAHSVKLPDGTPVGVWLREQSLTPLETEEALTAMGLDDDLVAFYVRTRQKGIEADRSLARDPLIASMAKKEAERDSKMETVRAAFIKAKGSKT